MTTVIKELLSLRESRDVEIKDLVAAFAPERVRRALIGGGKHNGLWGTSRLTFRGARFFTDDAELGSVYLGVDEAAHEWADDNEDMLTTSIEVGDYTFDVEYELGQECYLGYDRDSDQLVAGYELELTRQSQNRVEEELDERLQADARQSGLDEDEVREQFQELHNEFLEGYSQISVLLPMHTTNGMDYVVKRAKVFHTDFYDNGRSAYAGAKAMGLIDLRLD